MSIIIYGMGLSGEALKNRLKNQNLIFYDDNPQKSQVTYEQALLSLGKTSLVIFSPGVPKDAPLLLRCKELNIKAICEFEFGVRKIKARQIAVTGTNGKTTVCQLIHHILMRCGKKSYLLGNVGNPVSALTASNEDEFAVIEASSFQLEDFNGYNPFVAAITNIAPDHIDRHKSFENYILAKCNIFLNQSGEGHALFNYDDLCVKELSCLCKSDRVFYSMKEKNIRGCFLQENFAVCTLFESTYYIKLQNIKYYVKHNISNILCAVTASLLAGAQAEQIERALLDFSFDKHRLQYVDAVKGVKFYNDSKGTNIHATLSAIGNFDSYCLILGGLSKGCSYDELFENMCGCKFACVIGSNSDEVFCAAKRKGFFNIAFCETLEKAAQLCFEKALELNASCVLLSPASASFDMFKDYKERGDIYIKSVYEIKAKF